MPTTLDDLRTTLADHAEIADAGLAVRGAAVNTRVTRVRRRRRAALAGGVAAAVAVVGFGVANVPWRHDDAQPAQQPKDQHSRAVSQAVSPSVFAKSYGSEKLIKRAVAQPGSSELSFTFAATKRTIMRDFCQSKKAHVIATIDGELALVGSCHVRPNRGWAEMPVPAGRHTLRMWTIKNDHDRTERTFPDATFGAAVYDGSDTVTVAGQTYDRVTTDYGQPMTPYVLTARRVTPTRLTPVILQSGPTTAALVVRDERGRRQKTLLYKNMSGGESAGSPGTPIETKGVIELEPGHTYTLAVRYLHDGPGDDATVIGYKPAS